MVGKIGEYAVFEQLIEHHTSNNIFHSAHHGAIPNLSPHTAINTVIDKLLQRIDKGEIATLTLLDQRSAFDLIDHNTLLKKWRYTNTMKIQSNGSSHT